MAIFPEVQSQENTVLVVDDCPMNILAMRGLLDQFSVQSEYCNDGTQAFEAVKKRINEGKPMFGLILMDYSMPGMSGVECTRLIRELIGDQSTANQKPVICLVSAYGEKKF